MTLFEKLFSKRQKQERHTILVSDMNASYMQLIVSHFPNTQLIIDCFHIVKHINQALNDCSVHEMKGLIIEKKKPSCKIKK